MLIPTFRSQYTYVSPNPSGATRGAPELREVDLDNSSNLICNQGFRVKFKSGNTRHVFTLPHPSIVIAHAGGSPVEITMFASGMKNYQSFPKSAVIEVYPKTSVSLGSDSYVIIDIV